MNRKLIAALCCVYIIMAMLAIVQHASAGAGGSITFSQNRLPYLSCSYSNGVFFIGNDLQVATSLTVANVTKGIAVSMEGLSRISAGAEFSHILEKQASAVHFGVAIEKLSKLAASLLDDVRFKIQTSKNVSLFSSENIQYYEIRELNLELRFDDLSKAGFLVVYGDDTVEVRGVKGRTDMLLDPIALSSDVVTVTGYTSATPCTFADLWNADKAGERLLRASVAAAQDLSLTTQIMPTDNVSLKLRLVVTSYVSAGFINVTGTDKDGNAQVDYNIAISAAGNYSTSLWFKTVSTGGLDCNGSYNVAVYQLQWGVVWKQAAAGYTLDMKLAIGDGSTSTFFADINKLVLLTYTSADYGWSIKVYGSANLTLGNLDNAVAKTGKNGVSLQYVGTKITSIIQLFIGAGTVNLYACTVVAPVAVRCYLDVAGYVYCCNLMNYVILEIRSTSDVNRLSIIKSGAAAMYPLAATGTYNDIFISSATFAVYYYLLTTNTTITNLIGRNLATASLTSVLGTTADQFLIDADLDAWTIYWNNHPTNEIYRQNTFNLKVTDSSNTVLADANVTLKYYGQGGATIGTWLTNSSGMIAGQTLTVGFYNDTGGNTLYDYNPYSINITKSGYCSYEKNFSLYRRTNWEIALLPEETATVPPVAYVLFTLGMGFLVIAVEENVRRRRT
jgi:hypothetical protein